MLKEVRKRHPNQFSCAYLNINSFGYTFCSVKEKELLTTNTVDMLIIAETKLDNTFIKSQLAVTITIFGEQTEIHVEVDNWFI